MSKGDTVSQLLLTANVVTYGLTCAFVLVLVLVRLGSWQARLAGVLRICSGTDHPGPFLDRGRLGRGVGGVQGRRRRSRSDGSVWG